ncbi:MAG: hypothetical protein ABWX96_14630 [Propionibacteriaceae bacterium]
MSTVANSGDGLSRMVQNPKRYFEEARARAAAQVDEELRRSKRRPSTESGASSTPDQR